MEIRLVRTDAKNDDFVKLVKQLDAGLAITDGDDHAFYDQFNQLDEIRYVVVLYENNTAMSCGAIKEYDSNTMEVKRMYTTDNSRGKGYASRILVELESWTKELSFDRCLLETGVRQISAIALYEKNGYELIPNYGQYKEANDSQCYQKILS